MNNIFKKLFDLSYKRNWKEASGFYLVYSFLGITLGAILGTLVDMFKSTDTPSQSVKAMGIFTIIFCLVVSGLLLKGKKLYKNFGYIILALLSGILVHFVGALLTMIIPAFLTTREVK